MEIDQGKSNCEATAHDAGSPHGGLVAKSGVSSDAPEASKGARRQQRFRKRKLDEGFKSLNLMAPNCDRARSALRKLAVKVKDPAFLIAAEALASNRDVAEILSMIRSKIDQVIIKNCINDVFRLVRRALADPQSLEHLLDFSELDQRIRAAFFAALNEESALLRHVAERCLSDAVFRKAAAHLLADPRLAEGIVAHGVHASRLLAALSPEAAPEGAECGALDHAMIDEIWTFLGLDKSVRTGLLVVAQSTPDIVAPLAASRPVRSAMAGILPSVQKTELLTVLAAVDQRNLELFELCVRSMQSPTETMATAWLISLTAAERDAIGRLETPALVSYFSERRLKRHSGVQAATALNALLRFVTSLTPQEVNAIVAAQGAIRALAADPTLVPLVQLLGECAQAGARCDRRGGGE